MLIELITILSAISSISGIVAIIIVIWDRFKEDRILTKRVQSFYEEIEKYIFLSIKSAFFYELYDGYKAASYPAPVGVMEEYLKKEEKAEKEFFKIFQIKDTLRYFMNQKLSVYANYLGITTNEDREIINNSNIRINTEIDVTGDVMFIQNYAKASLSTNESNNSKNVIDNLMMITPEEIQIMNSYFEDLREHWKKNYAKSVLKVIKIRPKLKQKINFENLLKLNLDIDYSYLNGTVND